MRKNTIFRGIYKKARPKNYVKVGAKKRPGKMSARREAKATRRAAAAAKEKEREANKLREQIPNGPITLLHPKRAT